MTCGIKYVCTTNYTNVSRCSSEILGNSHRNSSYIVGEYWVCHNFGDIFTVVGVSGWRTDFIVA
jgi:hypothetical protein